MTAASSRCGALTPVALRAPSVSAPQRKTVYHVPGTKRSRCLGIDRHSCRRLEFLHFRLHEVIIWFVSGQRLAHRARKGRPKGACRQDCLAGLPPHKTGRTSNILHSPPTTRSPGFAQNFLNRFNRFQTSTPLSPISACYTSISRNKCVTPSLPSSPSPGGASPLPPPTARPSFASMPPPTEVTTSSPSAPRPIASGSSMN